MTLDRIGRLFLPVLDDALGLATDWLGDFHLYVQAWRDLLEEE